MQTVAQCGLDCATLCMFFSCDAHTIAHRTQKSRSPKRPRRSSWLCARIKFSRDAAGCALLQRAVCAFWLRTSSRSHRQVTHLRQNARHLHPVQLRQIRHDLRHELIFHQFANFFLPVPFSTGEQIRHTDLERLRQSLQGGQSRCCLLVFNFRHVCSRHRHTQRQLSLTQAIAQSQRSDRVGQLEMPAAVGIDIYRQHFWRGGHGGKLRLVLIQ
jgi:hypothetical protein